LEDREVLSRVTVPALHGYGNGGQAGQKTRTAGSVRRRTRAREGCALQGRGSHNEAMRGGIRAHGRRGRCEDMLYPYLCF